MTPNDQRHLAERQGRLRALLQSWGRKSQKIEQLNADCTALGPQESLKPSLFRKLMSWVEQLAGLRAKEMDIISEIDAIERKHGDLRKGRQLRKAAPKDSLFPEPSPDKEARPRDRFWLWLFLFWLMSRNQQKADAPKNG